MDEYVFGTPIEEFVELKIDSEVQKISITEFAKALEEPLRKAIITQELVDEIKKWAWEPIKEEKRHYLINGEWPEWVNSGRFSYSGLDEDGNINIKRTPGCSG